MQGKCDFTGGDQASRDYCWITAEEKKKLIPSESEVGFCYALPEKIAERLARFHLIDNTRGEPPLWAPGDIRKFEFSLSNGKLKGAVKLENGPGERGYEAEILGSIAVKAGQVTRFDAVAKGQYWGAGPYTGRGPKGKFPFAVAFTLVSGQAEADQVPPQGMKTNGAEYLK